MLKSYRQPITLPAVVTNYFEPSSNNIVDFVGGNRATHQMYVAHQIRLLNTVVSAAKGKVDAQPQEIAAQNRALTHEDFAHLKSIVERLIKADLVDYALADKMHHHLSDVFTSLFPHVQTLFDKGSDH